MSVSTSMTAVARRRNPSRCVRRGLIIAISAAAVATTGATGTATAAPDSPFPFPLIQSLDRAVPPPPIPRLATIPARSQSAGFDHRTLELRNAIMPSPTGDPFLDRWPSDLAAASPGDLIAERDVTRVGQFLAVVPVTSVKQIKFRSTDSTGAPSFGTATVLTPRSAWRGRGPRPVLVNDIPIVSLGAQCTPGYSFAHGISSKTSTFNFIPPDTINALLDGYQVLLPDHQGPRMAYAEPTVGGRITLDAIRALGRSKPTGFGSTRIALTGYSGGAIAVNGAVKLIDSYAPELKPRIVGAAMGGVPADFRMLVNSMNGTLAGGIFTAAELGVIREHPELLSLLSNGARWLASSPGKDLCGVQAGRIALPVPSQLLSNDRDPYHSPAADRVFDIIDMKNVKAGTPLFIYQGASEWWIPVDGALNLHVEQCRLGANSTFRLMPGEHATAALTGYPAQWNWLTHRLRGVPAPNGCA